MRSKMMTRWVTKWLQRHTKRLWRTLYMVSSWLMSKKSFSLSQILMKLKQYLQSLQMKTFYKLWKTESVQWLWGSEKATAEPACYVWLFNQYLYQHVNKQRSTVATGFGKWCSKCLLFVLVSQYLLFYTWHVTMCVHMTGKSRNRERRSSFLIKVKTQETELVKMKATVLQCIEFISVFFQEKGQILGVGSRLFYGTTTLVKLIITEF